MLLGIEHDCELVFVFHTLIIHENPPSGGNRVPVPQLDFRLLFFPAAVVQEYSTFCLGRICRSLLLTIDDRLQEVNLH